LARCLAILFQTTCGPPAVTAGRVHVSQVVENRDILRVVLLRVLIRLHGLLKPAGITQRAGQRHGSRIARVGGKVLPRLGDRLVVAAQLPQQSRQHHGEHRVAGMTFPLFLDGPGQPLDTL
jgi:hypothetical protein